MIITTTDSIDGRRIGQYLGIVSGQAVMATHIFKDMFAGIRDIVGGRSGSYKKSLRAAKEEALARISHGTCNRVGFAMNCWCIMPVGLSRRRVWR
jgi:uncharacterized protein YbjQ (UPF0145 family)